jgi:hypothetical protein
MTVSDDISVGPIDYLVVEFGPDGPTGEGMPHLVDLVDLGIIRILDLAFVQKNADGTFSGLELDAFGDDVDLTVFDGVSSGLLGDDDLEEASAAIEAGRSAAVLVYENVWAAPFATALRRGGAQLVASGRIPINAILSSLEATEQK